jgi:hypothetical protein
MEVLQYEPYQSDRTPTGTIIQTFGDVPGVLVLVLVLVLDIDLDRGGWLAVRPSETPAPFSPLFHRARTITPLQMNRGLTSGKSPEGRWSVQTFMISAQRWLESSGEKKKIGRALHESSGRQGLMSMHCFVSNCKFPHRDDVFLGVFEMKHLHAMNLSYGSQGSKSGNLQARFVADADLGMLELRGMKILQLSRMVRHCFF